MRFNLVEGGEGRVKCCPSLEGKLSDKSLSW